MIEDESKFLIRPHEAYRKLRGLGVLGLTLLTPFGLGGCFGYASVETDSMGRFKFGEDGRELFVFAWRENTEEDYRDFVAFDIDSPEQAWTRYGAVDILNHERLLRAVSLQEPIRVYRNILSWLQHDMRGICVVDWKQAWWKLRGGAKLVAEDPDHGYEIERLLARPNPAVPQILFPAEAVHE